MHCSRLQCLRVKAVKKMEFLNRFSVSIDSLVKQDINYGGDRPLVMSAQASVEDKFRRAVLLEDQQNKLLSYQPDKKKH
jgi:hypothetical protein